MGGLWRIDSGGVSLEDVLRRYYILKSVRRHYWLSDVERCFGNINKRKMIKTPTNQVRMTNVAIVRYIWKSGKMK